MSGAGEPERLDRFMARANAAYYAGRDPFADFTTAPEIAQQFGELLGAWAAVTWRRMGSPDPVLLCEAGPGRGTLMADALRLSSRVAPDFARAVRLHLVETSPRLRAIQAAALAGADPCWHDSIDTVPDGPLILLANEFLDALPIRQWERTPDGWHERFVQDGAFVLRPADPFLSAPDVAFASARSDAVPPGDDAATAGTDRADPAASALAGVGRTSPSVATNDAGAGPGCTASPPEHRSPVGTGAGNAAAPVRAAMSRSSAPVVVERCEAALAIVTVLARRVARSGGAVLLLDYGPDRPGAGDTLQALRDGRPAPPLADPGAADLTAHVDFPALRDAALAAGAAVHGPEGQGAFLSALGLFQRTERLARGRPPEQARALADAAHRLAAPERMGRLFKAMALCHPSLGVPPGFPAAPDAQEPSA